MKIALIGMPTSGKSTISRLVSKATGYPVVDVDYELEKKFNSTLQSFLDSFGEDKFIAEENNLLKTLKYPSNCIISTGGSVVYAHEAMEFLKHQNVKFIYLVADLKELESRLILQRSVRGIVMNGCKNWQELLTQRHSLYVKYADFMVSTSKKTEQDVFNEIFQYIKQEV